LLGEGEDRRRFSCAWGPVEEHVGEIAGLKRAGEDLDRVVLGGDFREGFGAAVRAG
jgi:hypothetical protein